MKNILIIIALAIASTTMAYSLSPIVVAVNYDNGENLSVSVTEGSGPAIYESEIEVTEPNSSGLIIFSVGDGDSEWEDILEASVTTSHVVNVMDNGTVVAQYRLDYLIDLSARMGLISSSLKVKGDVTIEGNTYNNGNLSLNSEEFTTADNLGDILTSNIMVYTGEGNLTIDEDDLFPGLPTNTLYYIANFSDDELTYVNENHFPVIDGGEFIILLKTGSYFYILNHESGFPFGPQD